MDFSLLKSDENFYLDSYLKAIEEEFEAQGMIVSVKTKVKPPLPMWKMKDYTITWQSTAGTEQGPYGRPYGLAYIGNDATLLIDRGRLLPEQENGKPKVDMIRTLSTCRIFWNVSKTGKILIVPLKMVSSWHKMHTWVISLCEHSHCCNGM